MMKLRKAAGIFVVACAVLAVMGCFEITKVTQPKSVKAGGKVTVKLEIKTDGTDKNPHYGIVAVKIPRDWEVTRVRMTGDYGKDEFKHLPANVPDGDPGGKVDYWQPQLERIWDPGEDMQWVVYQTSRSYLATKEIAFVDMTIEMKAGSTKGNFKIDYFITNAALDFSDPEIYAVSQDHPIEVQ